MAISTLKRMTTLFVVVVILGTSIALWADDWPNWRGPSNNGISAEKGWSPEAVSQKKILWSTNVGKGTIIIPMIPITRAARTISL